MRRALFAAAVVLATIGCQDEPGPRRQVLVVVDTDAPTPEDVAADPELSAVASVDTLRVDLLDEKDGVRVLREFAGTSKLDWPISFALIPPEVGDVAVARLRIRAFRARDAEATREAGEPTLAPPPELAIDRVVEVWMPGKGVVERSLVLLSTACLGRPSSFRDRTSCVDEAHLAEPFGAPLPEAPAGVTTRVATSPLARSVPCSRAAKPGRVCVPGGMSMLGSELASGVEDGSVILSALPLRLARVSPFFMDETEFTVGRARPLLAKLSAPPPSRKGAKDVEGGDYCTLSDDAKADRLPLNCVGDDTAKELCVLSGGTLPTEAQWNHAAGGRGDGRRYPWGDHHAGCCNASLGRLVRTAGAPPAQCPGEGVEAAGSHRTADACEALGDVSRDGVLDLGGSLTEILLDRAARLDDPCWGSRFGVLVDPVCVSAATESAARGGSWSSGTLNALAALRRTSSRGVSRGFRCVYRGDAK
jgi:formylglycine-generating enzyme required for sulfatase activity